MKTMRENRRTALLWMGTGTLAALGGGCGWSDQRKSPEQPLSEKMRTAGLATLGIQRQSKLLFAAGLRIEDHERQIGSISESQAQSSGLIADYQNILAAFVEQHRLLEVEKRAVIQEIADIARSAYQDRLDVAAALRLHYESQGQSANAQSVTRAEKAATEIERFGFLPEGFDRAYAVIDPDAAKRRQRFAKFYGE